MERGDPVLVSKTDAASLIRGGEFSFEKQGSGERKERKGRECRKEKGAESSSLWGNFLDRKSVV